MNTRAISVALALLLIANGVVLAEDTTHFVRDGEEASEVVLYLEKDVADSNTTVEFPNAEVLDATYVVSGGADLDGNYAEDVSVTIRGANWKYSGEGYGALGLQNEFSDSSSKKSASFSGDTGGKTSIELLLPVDAEIKNAEITLAGLPPAGELGEYRLTSKNTDGGSLSIYPSVVVDSSDTFAVWRDDGNLDDRVAARYKILFNLTKTSNINEFDMYIKSLKKKARLETNFKKLNIDINKSIPLILGGVNLQRLSNNPVRLKITDLKSILKKNNG